MLTFIENRGASAGPPRTHRNEFPAEYSLAGCSPAEPASASPAGLILHNCVPFAEHISANGSCRIDSVSHERAQSNSPVSTKLNIFQYVGRISLKQSMLKIGHLA